MSSKYVRDAVAQYLEDNWTDTPVLADENVFDQAPGDRSAWVSYGFVQTGERFTSLGEVSRCTREDGGLYLTVWVPSGSGSAAAIDHAENLRQLFRRLTLGAIRFGVASPPDQAIPSRVDASRGNWYGYQIVVDYEYDYLT